MTDPDPTQDSRLRLLFSVLREMDTAIVDLYRERGEGRVRSRFVLPLLRLAHRGPMTITALAEQANLTHSAMSQTISQMRAAGLVRSRAGADGRTREVVLTEAGLALVPLAAAEWRATEAAIAELEDELPYPLSRAAEDVADALARRSFAQRLTDHLPRSEGRPTAEGGPFPTGHLPTTEDVLPATGHRLAEDGG